MLKEGVLYRFLDSSINLKLFESYDVVRVLYLGCWKGQVKRYNTGLVQIMLYPIIYKVAFRILWVIYSIWYFIKSLSLLRSENTLYHITMQYNIFSKILHQKYSPSHQIHVCLMLFGKYKQSHFLILFHFIAELKWIHFILHHVFNTLFCSQSM